MSPSSTVRIVLVCEDQAHRALATFLADQVILDEALRRGADWINDASLGYYRRYSGLCEREGEPEEERYYPLGQAKADARDYKGPARLNGHINGQPAGLEASLWRRVFVLVASIDPPPDALVVVHDTDGDIKRRTGLDQALSAMKDLPHALPVVVAMPHQDAEAWFVAGFVPQNPHERLRLDECKKELAFLPPEEPHRLTAHPNDAPTDAKRVLQILLHGENRSRPPSRAELPALCDRTLRDRSLLTRRGRLAQLSAYLDDLRTILVPVVIPCGQRT